MANNYIRCPACLRDVVEGRPYCEWCGTSFEHLGNTYKTIHSEPSYSTVIDVTGNEDHPLSNVEIEPKDSTKEFLTNSDMMLLNSQVGKTITDIDFTSHGSSINSGVDGVRSSTINSDSILSNAFDQKYGELDSEAIENDDLDEKKEKNRNIILVLSIVIVVLLVTVIVLLIKNNSIKNDSNNTSSLINNPQSNDSSIQNNGQINNQANNSNNSNNSIISNDGFKIRINSEIRIRPSASTSGNILGHVYSGEVYYVYEVKETKDYTWYRIGDNMWIADGGGWTTRLNSENAVIQSNDILFRIVITETGNNVKIRSSPTTKNNNKVGNVKTGEEYDVYETIVGEGYNWYRIGTNRWIADGGGWIQIVYDYSYHNSNNFPNDVTVYQDSNGDLIIESSNSAFLDDLLGQWDEGGTEARQILLHFSKINNSYGVNSNLANIIRNGDGSNDMHRNGNTVVVYHHELGNSSVFVWNDYYDVYIKTLKYGDKTFENIYLSD